MTSEARKIGMMVQRISEVLIAIGYGVGLIPFGYLWSSNWVIPLACVSFICAWITSSRTLVYTIANIALAFLSFIPLIGYVFRIMGVLICWYNYRILRGNQR